MEMGPLLDGISNFSLRSVHNNISFIQDYTYSYLLWHWAGDCFAFFHTGGNKKALVSRLLTIWDKKIGLPSWMDLNSYMVRHQDECAWVAREPFASFLHGMLWRWLNGYVGNVRDMWRRAWLICSPTTSRQLSECWHGVGHAAFYGVAKQRVPSWSPFTQLALHSYTAAPSDLFSMMRVCFHAPSVSARLFCSHGVLHSLSLYNTSTTRLPKEDRPLSRYAPWAKPCPLVSTRLVLQAGLASAETRVQDMPILHLGHVDARTYQQWFTLFTKANPVPMLLTRRIGVDTAYIYQKLWSSQDGLAAAMSNSRLPRNVFFITLKVPCCPSNDGYDCRTLAQQRYGNSAGYNLTHAFLQSLRHLRVDYVDLLMLHWPCGTFTATLYAWRTLEQFTKMGKARALGVSNFNRSLLSQLSRVALIQPAVVQNSLGIGHSSSPRYGGDLNTLRFALDNGITYMAYSPLREVGESNVAHEIARRHGTNWAQIALRWLIQQGAVVVFSARNVSHLRSNFNALRIALSDSELEQLAHRL
jgi:diketogulonate reductase-like aldo/keto reductase